MSAQPAAQLGTERLILTVPDERSDDAIFEIHSDVRTYQHRPDLAMKTREEAVALRQQWQRNWSEDEIGYFAVATAAAPDTFIGFCGVRKSIEKDQDVLNVYYRFSPESQGKGFAKEATTAAIAWGRKKFPELPVVALIDPSNAASIRLAEKMEFTLDARSQVTGDHNVYRL